MKLDFQKFLDLYKAFKWLPVAVALAAAPAQATTHSKGNVTLFIHGFGEGAFHLTLNDAGQLATLTMDNQVDCSDAHYWGALPNYLRQQGYTGVFIRLAWYQNAVNCDDNLHKYGSYDEKLSWVDAGAALANYIYSNFTSKGIPVDIVAHSMGGVVARSAIWGASGQAQPWLSGATGFPTTQWPPPIDVGTVITVGSPHDGSNTIIVSACAGLLANQQICRETLRDGNSVKWLNDRDINGHTLHPAALNPQGRFGTQWLNIGAVETTLFHNLPLPLDATWASPPVASDGVIDTNSSLSMSIPQNNKLKLSEDETHLEYFFKGLTPSQSTDPLNGLIGDALKWDNNFYSQQVEPWGGLFNRSLNSSDSRDGTNSLPAANHHYELVQQPSDGNLVVYETYEPSPYGVVPHALWARPGALSPNAYTAMQDDGNLVTYSHYSGPGTGTGNALWASGTDGKGPSYAAMQDDGNLVIVQSPNLTGSLDGSGTFGGPVTWRAFSGPNSPIASINPNSTNGGFCMDIPEGKISSGGGDAVEIWTCHDGPNQVFVVDWDGTIRALAHCVTSHGANQYLTMEWCDGRSYQHWDAQPSGAIYLHDYPNLCIDTPSSHFTNGQRLQTYSCNQTVAQHWVIPRIESVGGSKCLSGANTNFDDGNPTVLKQCNGEVTQQWYTTGWWHSAGNITTASFHAAISTKNNKCLDVNHGNYVNGLQLQFWDCNGTQPQDWIWSSDQTIRPAPNTQLCVDVNQANYSDGTKSQLWTCNGGPNQKWGPPGGFSTIYPPAPPSSNGGIPIFGKTWEQQTPSVKTNPFASPQCTWGVMNLVHFYTQDWFLDGDWGVYPYVTGDAWQWRDQAIAAGWAVITDYTQPQVNSILVLQPNVGGAFGAGHVGWVTSVNNDGTITFNSTNWAGSGDAVVPATVKLQPGMSYILIPGPPSAGH